MSSTRHIVLSNLSKSYGAKNLFEEVNVTFHAGFRYGLTGPNGAGKSTLFNMITGKEEPSQGRVTLPEKTSILQQHIEEFAHFRVIDTVIMGNARLWKALTERDELYEKEVQGEEADRVGMRLGELEEIVCEEDGYAAESNAEVLLEGMGIASSSYEEAMHTLPTDQQFSVLLCQALFGNPHALLLDEPTNHLDIDSIRWLEQFLKEYTGVLIVISHNRHFLNSVCTHIADIDYETIITYPGNYNDMLITKTESREQKELAIKSREKKISQLQEFVSRFSSGTRASQVQSRIKEIDRLKPEQLKQSNIQRPFIRFSLGEMKPGQVILRSRKLGKSYDAPVLSSFSIDVQRGEKIAVIGKNGRGKTTLMRLLAEQESADEGTITWGHQVSVGYFPQNHTELVSPASSLSIFEWLKEQVRNVYDQDVRGVLGKLLFSGDDAFKSVSHLSGGETARLLLAKLMLEKPNVLLLDEPDNHLDLESVSALIQGLKEYEGTLLVVSHDWDLVSSVASSVIAFEEKGVSCFSGNVEEYYASKQAMSC